jgi:hypothetical protein
MKNLFVLIGLFLICFTGYGQLTYRCFNFNYSPEIDSKANGIWGQWERTIETDSTHSGNPDSLYFNLAGLPDFGDLKTFDMEVKMKALWYNDSVFFLFQRLDDLYVNGLDNQGQPDNTVADGLDNLDATKIYFYLSSDSLRIQDTTYNYSDSIAWLQFVWKSEVMEARLPSGEIVNTYNQFNTNAIQWCDDTYCYAKLGIDMGKLAPYLMNSVRQKMNDYGLGGFGFFLETTDNDKEVLNENDLYIIQTRAFWGWSPLIDSAAIDEVNKWHWMAFFQDTTNYYVNPIYSVQEPFASVYPVPAYNTMNIHLDNYDEIEYVVYDIMGRKMLAGDFSGYRHSFSVEQLTVGTYIIQMKNKNRELMSVKMFKMKH